MQALVRGDLQDSSEDMVMRLLTLLSMLTEFCVLLIAALSREELALAR